MAPPLTSCAPTTRASDPVHVPTRALTADERRAIVGRPLRLDGDAVLFSAPQRTVRL